MMKNILLIFLCVILFSSFALAYENDMSGETVSGSEVRSYSENTISKLMEMVGRSGDRFLIYGLYDSDTKTLSQNDDILNIKFDENCDIYGRYGKCSEQGSGWVSVTGIFSYDDFELLVEGMSIGTEEGFKCKSHDECQSDLCLYCPGMKMIQAGFMNYENLPENTKTIKFDVSEGFETQSVSMIVINPAPDYGYCAGGGLQPYGLNHESVRNSAKKALVDNDVLEIGEPVWWADEWVDGHEVGLEQLDGEQGSSGYCIGEWNDNKYKWVRASPGDEKYLDMIKNYITTSVSEEYLSVNTMLRELNIKY